jgi:hypothetical protein
VTEEVLLGLEVAWSVLKRQSDDEVSRSESAVLHRLNLIWRKHCGMWYNDYWSPARAISFKLTILNLTM